MIVISGMRRRMVSSITARFVSHSRKRFSPNSPIRVARSLICLSDSSPDIYSTFRPSSAMCRHTCKRIVDLPMPGSPPTRIREPGTMPPPKTLSSSCMCVDILSSSCSVISESLEGFPSSRAVRPAMPEPAVFAFIFSSTKVFHSLQPGHCPIHFEDSYPQL